MGILDLFVYYWPKLIAAVWFAVFNCIVLSKFHQKKHMALRGILFFLISSAFLSILAEYGCTILYRYTVHSFGLADKSHMMFVSWGILGDFIAMAIGAILYVHVAGLRYADGIAVYLEYVCIERLCMILAVDQTTYLLWYIAIQVVFFLVQRKDMEYILDTIGLPPSPIDGVDRKLYGVPFNGYYQAASYMMRYSAENSNEKWLKEAVKSLTGGRVRRLLPWQKKGVVIWWNGVQQFLLDKYPAVLTQEESITSKTQAELLLDLLSTMNNNRPQENDDILKSDTHAVLYALNNVYAKSKRSN